MNAGLWQKESRALVPFLVVVVCLGALDPLTILLTEHAFLKPLAVLFNDSDQSAWISGSVFGFIVAMALSAGLLVREFDAGTIEFLDALPVSRLQVFVVKTVLAALVLLILPLSGTLADLALHLLSRTSLDPGLHASLAFTTTFLEACQIVVFLGIALPLSFLRWFAWIVMGLLGWCFILLEEQVPALRAANPLLLTVPVFEGDRWVIPWKMIAIQLPIGAVGLVIAAAAFCGAGERLLAYFRRHRHSWVGRLLPGIGAVGIVALAISLLLWAASSFQKTANTGPMEFPEWSHSRAATQHYKFIYPTNLEQRALSLVEESDRVYREVQTFFRAPATPSVTVDLTGAGQHYAGLAFWETVRIDLTKNEQADDLAAVLAHETAHVFIDQLSNRRLADAYATTRFFHEGVAGYVEHRFFRSGQELALQRSVAAVVRARREIDINELIDSEKLSRRRDGDLVYALGEVFVAGMVAMYGDDAPSKVLAAFRRENAPRELSGMELWQDVFQAAGYSFEAVIDRFFSILDEEVKNHRAVVDRLTRLHGAVVADEAQLGVRVDARVSGWRVVCRFRDQVDSATRDYEYASQDKDGVCWISRDHFSGETFWYQLGFIDANGERAIYEPWAEAVIP